MRRWTVVVSTLTAVLLLGAGVTADPERAVSVEGLAGLRSDLEFQVRTAFRFDAPARDARLAALEDADRAWQESPQTEADRRLMAGWLRGAIAASMPGSRAPLPEMPAFSEPVVVSQPADKAPAAELPVVVETPALPVEVANESVPEPARPVIVEGQSPPADTTAAPPVLEPIVTSEIPKTSPEPIVRDNEPVARTVDASSLLISERRPLAPRRPAVGVNLAELTVRVATYHDLLDEIESAVAGSADWDASAVESLRRLVLRTREEHRFATMYYGVLSATERDRVLHPRDPSETVRRAAEAVEHWRALQDRDFLAP